MGKEQRERGNGRNGKRQKSKGKRETGNGTQGKRETGNGQREMGNDTPCLQGCRACQEFVFLKVCSGLDLCVGARVIRIREPGLARVNGKRETGKGRSQKTSNEEKKCEWEALVMITCV